MIRIEAAAAGETRKAGAPTPASTNFVNYSTHADSITALRLQRLKSLCGLVGAHAGLVSSLAWGEAVDA